ncbi:MAG: META domain-containing protein, partial [Anaerolineae bacterium]|nr:META domain-containing protein [Anaerolineae bacterium]
GLYPAIVLATNRAAMADAGYATIADPWRIEVGWKLRLPDAAEARSGLTLTALENATFASEWTKSKQATLVDGEYMEEILPGSASKVQITLGDRMAFGLTPDGAPWAVVVLYTSSGGSGTFRDLAVMAQGTKGLTQLASTSLGDRTVIESLAVEDGEIVVQRVAHGPSDPMCCPTQRVRERYRIVGGTLEKSASELLGDAIAEVTWEWVALRAGDGTRTEVPEPSAYTLRLEPDGRFSGQADCNRINGPYALEGTQLTLGPAIASTRAMCPPGSLSEPFVQHLGQAVNYVISGEQLILMLDANGGQMFFRRGSYDGKR